MQPLLLLYIESDPHRPAHVPCPFLWPSTPKSSNEQSYPAPTARHSNPPPPNPSSNSNQQQLPTSWLVRRQQAGAPLPVLQHTLCTPWLHSPSANDVHRQLHGKTQHSQFHSHCRPSLSKPAVSSSGSCRHRSSTPTTHGGAVRLQHTPPTQHVLWAPPPPAIRCLQSVQPAPGRMVSAGLYPTTNNPRGCKNGLHCPHLNHNQWLAAAAMPCANPLPLLCPWLQLLPPSHRHPARV